MKKSLCAALFFAFMFHVQGVTIAERGRTLSQIIIPQNAPEAIQHAADELSRYLGKITVSQPVPVGQIPANGINHIFLGTITDADLIRQCTMADQLKEDGFLIKSENNTLWIIGKNPRGTLYGTYEVLKRYAKIRWLYPGIDGEYFSIQEQVTVPDGEQICNPSFQYRAMAFNSCITTSFLKDSWDWQIRNNMQVNGQSVRYSPEVWKYLEKLDAVSRQGGHLFSLLLVSPYEQDMSMEELYEKHPEYFPLINGKRTFLKGQQYNPCTTNPDVIARMKKNLLLYIKNRMKPGDYLIIGNNDGTGWCQCENCLILDPESEKKNNSVATRYWTLINQLAAEAWKYDPTLILGGWAYQNFQQPPDGIKPDPRLFVMLTYNNHCFRHALENPQCPVNKIFHEYYRKWSTFGNRLTAWEQADAAIGWAYQPLEKIYFEKLKSFQKYAVSGPLIITQPVDGQYPPERLAANPMLQETFHMQWPFSYLAARFLWDMERNWETEYDQANALYYGNAWKNGMQQYRKLLEKAAIETPCCHGWGLNSPIGRCLEKSGLKEQLLNHLEKAISAVQNDPRALTHVQRDHKYFQQVWVAEYNRYIAGFREIKAFEKRATVFLDGDDRDPDWKNSIPASSFNKLRTAGEKPEKATVQTSVKVLYEAENLYLYIEGDEPDTSTMKAAEGKRDGALWMDNSFEIFINHPDLAHQYYHFIINSANQLYDSFCDAVSRAGNRQFTSSAESFTRILPDRWIAEIKIPTSELGMKCLPGTVWKINIGRNRILLDGSREHSALAANGAFHGVSNFLPLIPSGKFNPDNQPAGIDDTPWKNGTFDHCVKYHPSKIKDWTITGGIGPVNWSLDGNTGSFEMSPHPDNPNNLSLKLTGGAVYQFYSGAGMIFNIRLKARGKGTLKLRAYRNHLQNGKRKGLPSREIDSLTLNSDEWQDFAFEYTREFKDECFAFVMEHHDGEVCVDDISIFPK